MHFTRTLIFLEDLYITIFGHFRIVKNLDDQKLCVMCSSHNFRFENYYHIWAFCDRDLTAFCSEREGDHMKLVLSVLDNKVTEPLSNDLTRQLGAGLLQHKDMEYVKCYWKW